MASRNPAVHPKPALGKRSPEWPRVRAAHLKAEPVCRACRTRRNLEVHHVLPFHIHPELELRASNLVTLCEQNGHDCHFVFGHFHNWRNWNPDVRADVATYNTQRKSSPLLRPARAAGGPATDAA